MLAEITHLFALCCDSCAGNEFPVPWRAQTLPIAQGLSCEQEFSCFRKVTAVWPFASDGAFNVI